MPVRAREVFEASLTCLFSSRSNEGQSLHCVERDTYLHLSIQSRPTYHAHVRRSC